MDPFHTKSYTLDLLKEIEQESRQLRSFIMDSFSTYGPKPAENAYNIKFLFLLKEHNIQINNLQEHYCNYNITVLMSPRK